MIIISLGKITRLVGSIDWWRPVWNINMKDLTYVWIPLILLKTENNKNNNFWLLFKHIKHCSFILIHCSYPMNSARDAVKKKIIIIIIIIKEENAEWTSGNANPNGHLDDFFTFHLLREQKWIERLKMIATVDMVFSHGHGCSSLTDFETGTESCFHLAISSK